MTDVTPTYDRLRAKANAEVAAARASDRPISATTYRLLRSISGKAITSGQRAGERAAHNVYDAHDRRNGTYGNYPTEVREHAMTMAKAASARARERYAIRLVKEGLA